MPHHSHAGRVLLWQHPPRRGLVGQSGASQWLRRTFFTEQWWQCWSRASEGLWGLQQHKKDKALSTPGSPAFGRAWAGGLQPECPQELMENTARPWLSKSSLGAGVCWCPKLLNSAELPLVSMACISGHTWPTSVIISVNYWQIGSLGTQRPLRVFMFVFFFTEVSGFSGSLFLSHTRILCSYVQGWSLHNLPVEMSVWGGLGQITQSFLVKVSWNTCLLMAHVRARAWVTVWPSWLTRGSRRSPVCTTSSSPGLQHEDESKWTKSLGVFKSAHFIPTFDVFIHQLKCQTPAETGAGAQEPPSGAGTCWWGLRLFPQSPKQQRVCPDELSGKQSLIPTTLLWAQWWQRSLSRVSGPPGSHHSGHLPACVPRQGAAVVGLWRSQVSPPQGCVLSKVCRWFAQCDQPGWGPVASESPSESSMGRSSQAAHIKATDPLSSWKGGGSMETFANQMSSLQL